MIQAADLAQTFYLDKDSVKKASVAFIKSINLYFRNKPKIARGGVTVYICRTKYVGGFAVPDLSDYVKYGRSRLKYDQINTSLDGLTATTFNFTVPVPVNTAASYAIVIKMDFSDAEYVYWANQAGETYNDVKNPPVSKGALDGRFFTITNGDELTPQADVDLKFQVNAQKFITSNTIYSALNRNFEFLSIDPASTSDSFLGGELVFANTGVVAAQTISVSMDSTTIVGTGTTFTNNFTTAGYIVLKNGTDHSIRAVDSIVNNTVMILETEPPFTNSAVQYIVAPVAKMFRFQSSTNAAILIASTANATHNFYPNTTSNTIVGEASEVTAIVTGVEDFKLSKYESAFGIVSPANTYSNVALSIASNTYGTRLDGDIYQNREKWKLDDLSVIHSRSAEVKYGSALDNGKSMNFKITFGSGNEFVSPYLDEEDMLFFGYEFVINNDTTNEHTNSGNAIARHVSKRITLADGQDSEDIKVYVTAFRPLGTDVNVYAKFYNESDPDSFSEKSWTKLEPKTSPNLVSPAGDITSFVELEYGLPAYPIEDYTTKIAGDEVPGKFSISNNTNCAIGTTSTVNTYIAPGDVVRIYSPLFPNNSLVTTVADSNTTGFVLGLNSNVITSNTRLSSFVTSGLLVEKCTYPNMAYKNYINGGVVRYHNTDLSAFDTYKSFAFKIVLTSSQLNLFPFVDDFRGIAVSI